MEPCSEFGLLKEINFHEYFLERKDNIIDLKKKRPRIDLGMKEKGVCRKDQFRINKVLE